MRFLPPEACSTPGHLRAIIDALHPCCATSSPPHWYLDTLCLDHTDSVEMTSTRLESGCSCVRGRLSSRVPVAIQGSRATITPRYTLSTTITTQLPTGSLNSLLANQQCSTSHINACFRQTALSVHISYSIMPPGHCRMILTGCSSSRGALSSDWRGIIR
jgi:hypothetical protein